ncbi:hypothetical protein CEW92_16975, partial [Bacillaceae bacterium SAS-127]
RSWTTTKCGRRCLAAYGLDPSDRDKENTVNDSELILTYRKEEGRSPLDKEKRNADSVPSHS